MLMPSKAVDSLPTVETILIEFTDLGEMSTYSKSEKDMLANAYEIAVEQEDSFEIETLNSDISLQSRQAVESAVTLLQSQQSRYTQQDISDIAAEIARIGMNNDRTGQSSRIRRITPYSIKGFEEEYYLAAWVHKVQRIGQLNYPQESSEKSQYGILKLLAAIFRDGQLLNVRIIESSGYSALDDAAVRLAAPYAPFPAEMRKTTDTLEIVHTWQFSKSALFPS